MMKLPSLLLVFCLFAFSAPAQKIPVWKLADLRTALQSNSGPTIINFWATFCKPCLAELPHFQQLANQYKSRGVKLVLVNVDLKEAYPKKIASFSNRFKLTAPVVFLAESNADLFCPAVDSSWTGAIPATILFDNKKGYRRFFEEELSAEKLKAEIQQMLKAK